MTQSHSLPPIAYLTGEYPKVSHTFIQREITALRHAGWTVEACTVRRAPAKDVVGQDQRDEQTGTFCILEAAKSPARLIKAHMQMLRRDPKRWISSLKLAWSTRPPGLKAGLWQMFYFLEAGVLSQHLLDRGVRHLHNHFANSSCSVAMLTSEMSGIPFSVTMHGPAIFFEPMWWRIDAKIARAAFVSCISHFCRSQAMFFSDTQHWSKLKIVHCGVEPENYGRDPHAAPGKEVIFVGRLSAVKGVPLLIEAFARIHADHPDARLSIVGDGDTRAEYEALAAACGAKDSIAFLGYQSSDEVAALMARSDVLVLASFAEGVPVTLMEAMASRLPVIASRVAGVSELIDDGISGYTIPAGDVDTLTARLDTLLSDPDLRDRMGCAGRDRVSEQFDLHKEAMWLGDILHASLTGTLPPTLRPPLTPPTP
ncbi:colanic acid biosynthesis glycosyltransferase WcaL [Thioclava sp. SK-1]|uniref:glycosyltransferase family 4 protein n=1 Tax=Thioclava sp. SK-1 TaxID=1889770 RepID=UPI0008253872|nr:glycosyltransferase family 4 protein [Thioclava sp. SK-1]OCX66407.1 colanic acid biosynthesis glycosyltransferase WcaL [Thioclava sp. SK-1]